MTRDIVPQGIILQERVRRAQGPGIFQPSRDLRKLFRKRIVLPEYVVTRLTFGHEVAPAFGPWLFAPAARRARTVSARLRALQSGPLNLSRGLIGLLLVIILAPTLVPR